MSVKVFEDLLRIVIRTFYHEHAVVAVEHILHYSRAGEHLSNEEHKMSEDLNLPCQKIRERLNELKKHGILVSKEGKKDTRSEEKTGNMFTRGPDQKKMVYWSFDPDLKNVIISRILQLKQALNDLVEEANRTDFICTSCNKIFTADEYHFNKETCDRCCDKKPLKKKEKDVESAMKRKEEGLKAIKLMETRMKECLDVTLPVNFFGTISDNSKNKEKNLSVVAPLAGATSYIVDIVPVPEENTEKWVEDSGQRDTEAIKYYQRIERKSKKQETLPCDKFLVQGNPVDVNEIDGNMQMIMTEEEFEKFYSSKVGGYDYY